MFAGWELGALANSAYIKTLRDCYFQSFNNVILLELWEQEEFLYGAVKLMGHEETAETWAEADLDYCARLQLKPLAGWVQLM